jgi:hypothetical protein
MDLADMDIDRYIGDGLEAAETLVQSARTQSDI